MVKKSKIKAKRTQLEEQSCPNLEDTKLDISIPHKFFRHASVSDIATLSRRITQMPMPSGWMNLTDQTQSLDNLILSSTLLNLSDLSVSSPFVLRVDNTMRWTVKIHDNSVNAAYCQFITGSPVKITCVADAIMIMKSLSSSRICNGNTTQEFKELTEFHMGIFKDRSGQHNYYVSTIVLTY